ncbi:DUF3134 domain-containing protein [Oscillatoriales cyanobacterium LEGE 11467]|uniref:DUF3134 domain-containing protein n=1 Tax=Zarconia navalis LEGE 11467 TaxID=1828826 RepID=A0A928Z8G3_9CYAN|nr:DUF3134 domain-containing protein [Zarconia navalis]MBE9039821.1 DUF3134 domain-containing protein [Zarconia navalis LEGE 11467]
MSQLNNPSLKQLPRHEAAEVIPLNQETSILDWLQATGRLIPRDEDEQASSQQDEGLDGLIVEDDVSFEEEEDDDDA